MSERLIWRIEKPNDSGEHRGPYGMFYFGASHGDMETHPSPQCDVTEDGVSLGIRPFEFCATASLSELAEWFKGFGKKLADADYKVVAFAVEDRHMRMGRRQVVFQRDRARVVHEMDPMLYISTMERVDD